MTDTLTRPLFYKFGDAIYLSKIGTQDWIKYICRRFEVTGKQISEELAEKICQKVDNHSSYVQQLAWLVWIHTDRVATEQDFEAAYQDIIDQNTPLFEKQTESLTTYQMNFLRAIIDGIHSEFTTQEVLHKYQLGSSANVSIVKRALVKKELIERNPVEMTIARTVDKKKQELLTDEECAKLFDIDRIQELWNDRIVYYVYSLVAGLTGLRAGELLALTINEVKHNKIIVKRSYNESYGMSTTKTSEEREVPITAEIYRYLYVAWQSHPNDENDYIFSFDGKKPMNEGRARAAFYKAMEKIGISEEERLRRGITFHSWRHKFTTDCVKSNMHPEKIMALTGHKSTSMLLRYTDLNPEKDLSSQIQEIQDEKSRRIIGMNAGN